MVHAAVLIKSEAEGTGAGPLGSNGVGGLEGDGEMLGVFAAGILNSEIIVNQTEEDRTGSSMGSMGEETGCFVGI